MRAEHKKYIFENIGRRTSKQIARDLGVKEKKVARFIKESRIPGGKAGQRKDVKTAVSPMNFRKVFFPVVLIAVLGLAIYANSLGGKFLWDDEFMVQKNGYLTSWTNVWKFFAGVRTTAESALSEDNFYRPIYMTTFLADRSIWGLDVRGFHLTNIILHIAAALALFWMLNVVFKDLFLSGITSVFFIIHPVHTEAISYISGRSDPLAALFIFLSLTFYAKALHAERRYFLLFAGCAYVMGLLSRESSLVVLLALPLINVATGRRMRPGEIAPFFGITAAYFMIRMVFLSGLKTVYAAETTFLQRLPGFFRAFFEYLRLMVLPFDLHMEYGSGLFSFTEARVVVGATVFIVFLVILAKKTVSDKTAFFAMGWFLLTLLPVSNLYHINAYMAEHWLYVPSVGIFLLVSKTLLWLRGKSGLGKRSVTVVIFLLVVFFSFLTVRQNGYWRDAVTFYERTIRYAPESLRIAHNLSVEYIALGRPQEAIELSRDVLEKKPADGKSYCNIGNAYLDMNNLKEAEANYKKALEVDPGYAEAYYNLGNVFINSGRPAEAVPCYLKAVELKPGYRDAFYNLGNAYLDLGDARKAVQAFNSAVEIDSSHKDSYFNLGLAYIKEGKYDEAAYFFEKVIELAPHDAEAHSELQRIYKNIKKPGI